METSHPTRPSMNEHLSRSLFAQYETRNETLEIQGGRQSYSTGCKRMLNLPAGIFPPRIFRFSVVRPMAAAVGLDGLSNWV